MSETKNDNHWIRQQMDHILFGCVIFMMSFSLADVHFERWPCCHI